MATEHSESETNNQLIPKNRKKKRRSSRKMGFNCSWFTILLILSLIEIGRGAILNVSKIISYQGKMVTLEGLLKKSQARNSDLKSEKKVVTSDNSLEGIARNNLKMAGEDEVLIIINKKVEEPKTTKHKWKMFDKKQNKENADTEVNENIYIPPEVVEE